MKTIVSLLVLFSLCAFGEDMRVLAPTNSAEGPTLGWGAKDGSAKLTLVKDKGDTTDGDGALHLSMTSPTRKGNKYLSFKISLPASMDLRASRVVFDARTNHPGVTGAFYVRLYNAGESKPAWSFNSWSGQLKQQWRTFSIQRQLCMDGLAWESDVVEDRVADRVQTIEFIMGTHDDAVEVDLLVDNILVGERVGSLDELTRYKPILVNTDVVVEGKPVALVLHPASEAGRAAGATIVEAVRKATGVTLESRAATEADRIPETTTIVIGSVDSNPAMLLLYGRRLTPVDSVCPGAGGALVHTVYDPFGKGANTIVLGASDEAGITRAAEMFAKAVAKNGKQNSLRLPRLFERHYSEEFLKIYPYAADEPSPKRLEQGLKAGQRCLDRGTHTSIAGELASVAQRYALTGHSVEAQLYVQLWDMYAKSAVADPRKFGGPWGFDSDFPSRQVVPGWDLVEEDPSLTDEERVKTLRHLGRWMAEAVVTSCAGAATSTHVPHNHQTFPALGTLLAGLYMSQSFPNSMEGPYWLSIADRIFRRQATYFKPYEDCNGYQWLTNGHLFGYALARPDFTIFENGNGRKIIDYCIGNMDNLGYQVPYGDTGSWKCWDSETICLDRYAFATGDASARWGANWKRQVKKTRRGFGSYMEFEPGIKPDCFDGVRVWELEPAWYGSFPTDDRPPLAACFDKITFREAMDPKAAYLLLDGLSTGGHKHFDGNSIPRITQFARIWLADNDYYKQPVKFHNSMLVFRDGVSQQIPSYTELLGAGETTTYGYSRSRVNGYAGADWDRTIVWLKAQKAFVILDRLTATEPGAFQFRLLWHGVGEVTFSEDHGMLLRQHGPSMSVQVAPGPRLGYHDDNDLGKNWAGYPHADPVVRALEAVATPTLPTGESYLFATVIHGRADGDEPLWPVEWLTDDYGVRVQTPQGLVAIGLGPLQFSTADGVFITDAKVVVADTALTLLGATNADFNGEPLFMSPTRSCADIPEADTSAAVVGLPTRPPVAQEVAATNAPEQDVLWDISPAPASLLLSGNKGMTGSVMEFATMTSTPPAAQNVFSAGAANTADALTDGSWSSADACVMYEPDKEVTVTCSFASVCEISGVAWKQWWASTSSKKTAYKLAEGKVTVSVDNFHKDARVLGSVRETGTHSDWGSPVDYRVEGTARNVRTVRLTFTPQPGTAIYLAELFVYGKAPKGAKFTTTGSISRICPVRGPEGQRLAVGTGEGALYVYDAQGKLVWSKSGTSRILDMCAVDLDGNGTDELAIGRQNSQLTVRDSSGKTLWMRELPYYRKPGYVNVVRSGDLDGDGTPEVVCGGENWRFYAFSADGTELWNYESVHPSRSGAVADLDADGKAETLCGTHYYWMSVLNYEGLPQWKGRFGPICWDIATGVADAKGRRNVITGSGGGQINAFDSKGKTILTLNTGDEVRQVTCGDLDGDGIDEFLAGSMNYSVYCFGADMKLRWRTDMGDAVSALVTAPVRRGRGVMVGTNGGRLVTLGTDGTVLASTHLSGEVLQLCVLGKDVAVSLANGHVMLVRP